MPQQFEEAGLRFTFPDDWTIERESDEDSLSLTLQGPGTAFMMISQDTSSPDPDEMLASSLEALEAEYEYMEVEERVDSFAELPAFGHDVHFIVLDLPNTCCVRTFTTDNATYMILWQATDTDMEQLEETFEGICQSIELINN
ncbi:MAG: hypothetical protein ACFCD0_09625 [Gemmataceae bacterium]